MTALEFARLVRDARRRTDSKWWDAQCPAHDDQRASLSFADGDRALIVECHAGCSADRIATAVGHTVADFFHDRPAPRARIVATYAYVDEGGTLLYEVVRFAPKDFRPRRPDGHGGWIWNLQGVRRVLYRLDEIPEHRRVFLCEGEKDVDALMALGLPATTSSGGADGWRDDYAAQLRDVAVEEIVIVPDHDAAGVKYAHQAAASLARVGLRVRMLELPGLADKGDVSDWLIAQRGAGQAAEAIRAAVLALAASAPLFTAAAPRDAGPVAPTLRFRHADDLLRDPPPVSIVAGAAWAGSVTTFVSESGVGKTFLLLDLAAAVSDGRPWHGRPIRAGSVAYISFEGDALGLRLLGLREAGAPLAHLHCLHGSNPISPSIDHGGLERPSAGERALADALADLARWIEAASAPPLRLLILDTVRASLTGSEDRSEDVAAYLRAVRRLMGPYPDAGGLLAHHAGWQDGETRRKRERGSSALRGNVDATLYVELTDEDRELGRAYLTVNALKVRDDAKPPPLRLVRTRVTLPLVDETGRPYTTCLIETDSRSRDDLEAERTRVEAEAHAELDERAYDLITGGTITSVKALRLLLGVRYDLAEGALARLLRAGRVFPPQGQRAPYTTVNGASSTGAPSSTESHPGATHASSTRHPLYRGAGAAVPLGASPTRESHRRGRAAQ